jgi:type VI secretion system secreted protein Hcp
MAVDMFLVFNSAAAIHGESNDADAAFKNIAIDVLAFSWGESNSGTTHVGGGGGAGKVNVQDLSITKYVDKSSPVLMLMVANGKHIVDATLTVRKAGENPIKYIVIKMKEVMVTSLSTGGSGGEDRLTENITLNFGEVEFDYLPQKTDGTADTAVSFKWDIAGNKKL